MIYTKDNLVMLLGHMLVPAGPSIGELVVCFGLVGPSGIHGTCVGCQKVNVRCVALSVSYIYVC